jgi:hypothetical protein
VYAGEITLARENLLLGRLRLPAGKPGGTLNVALDVDGNATASVCVRMCVRADAAPGGQVGKVRAGRAC